MRKLKWKLSKDNSTIFAGQNGYGYAIKFTYGSEWLYRYYRLYIYGEFVDGGSLNLMLEEANRHAYNVQKDKEDGFCYTASCKEELKNFIKKQGENNGQTNKK